MYLLQFTLLIKPICWIKLNPFYICNFKFSKEIRIWYIVKNIIYGFICIVFNDKGNIKSFKCMALNFIPNVLLRKGVNTIHTFEEFNFFLSIRSNLIILNCIIPLCELNFKLH